MPRKMDGERASPSAVDVLGPHAWRRSGVAIDDRRYLKSIQWMFDKGGVKKLGEWSVPLRPKFAA